MPTKELSVTKKYYAFNQPDAEEVYSISGTAIPLPRRWHRETMRYRANRSGLNIQGKKSGMTRIRLPGWKRFNGGVFPVNR